METRFVSFVVSYTDTQVHDCFAPLSCARSLALCCKLLWLACGMLQRGHSLGGLARNSFGQYLSGKYGPFYIHHVKK
jgi:hypothetical protein